MEIAGIVLHCVLRCQGTKEAVMFLSIPACWKQSTFLLLKIKSPRSLFILLLGARCVHILKENWLVEESLSSGKISDVWQNTQKPVPKISPELLLSVCVCVCVCVCTLIKIIQWPGSKRLSLGAIAIYPDATASVSAIKITVVEKNPAICIVLLVTPIERTACEVKAGLFRLRGQETLQLTKVG